MESTTLRDFRIEASLVARQSSENLHGCRLQRRMRCDASVQLNRTFPCYREQLPQPADSDWLGDKAQRFKSNTFSFDLWKNAEGTTTAKLTGHGLHRRKSRGEKTEPQRTTPFFSGDHCLSELTTWKFKIEYKAFLFSNQQQNMSRS